MDIIAYVNLEIVKNDRRYTFSMPVGSAYIDCHEAALEVAQKIVEMAKLSEDQAKAYKAEQEKQILEPELVS